MKKTTWAVIALMLSCMASGNVTAERKPYKVSNYPSHDSSFFGKLVSGRVWVYSNPERKGYANAPHAQIFHENGRHLRCTGHRTGGGKLHWVETETNRWEADNKFEASLVNVYKKKKPGFLFLFYDPEAGTLANEVWREGRGDKIIWTRHDAGWVQDSWPRLFADGCPGIELPDGMAVNEKQTSSSLRELREQDPDAVIRNFPGSAMTGPGRVGIAAHDVPTTTKKEVWAFLDAQEGNVMLGPQGHGRVFVRGPDGSRTHEIWGLKDEGDFAWTASLEERDESGREWLFWTFNGKVVHRYRMGDPLPYLPTGYRHAAFQLTDALIEAGEPVALPWMPSEWKDFAFSADGTVRARRADGGPDSIAPWRWTQGRLLIATDGKRDLPDWEEVAEQLGMEKPKLWTRADGQRIEMASAGSETSGTGRCAGEYEGTATWTLGSDGKRVWDLSGCERRTE